MQKEKNSSVGFYIVIALLIAVIIGMSVYLLYDKKVIFSKSEETNTGVQEPSSDSSSEDESVDSPNSKSTVKVLSGSYADSTTATVLYNGDVYISFERCPVVMGSYNGIYKDFCSSVDNIINAYREYDFGDFEYESYEHSKFLGLKLNVSGVKQFYPIMQGQATVPRCQGLAIVKENGTLEVISFQNIVNNQLTPSPTPLQNIIQVKNVTGETSMNTIATDASGNTHDLSEYLK